MPYQRLQMRGRAGDGIRTGLPPAGSLPLWVLGSTPFLRYDPREQGNPDAVRTIEGGMATYEIPITDFSGDLVFQTAGTSQQFPVTLLRNTVNARFINLTGTVLASINGCPWQTVLNNDTLNGVQLHSLTLLLDVASAVTVQLSGT